MIYYVVGLTLVLLFAVSAFFNWRKRRRLLAYFANDYYETNHDTPDADHLARVRRYWEAKKTSEGINAYIDDTTWDDLDMDHVFARINACESSIGEECLYARLRTVCMDEDALRRFGEAVDFMDGDRPTRAKVQYALHMLGKDPYNNVCDYIYNIDGQPIRHIWAFYVLMCLPFVFALSCFFSPAGYGLTAAAVLVNTFIYYRNKFQLNMSLNAMTYITGMVRCARMLVKLPYGTQDYGTRLSGALQPLRKLSRFGGVATRKVLNDFEVVLEYIKMVVLWDFIRYDRMVRLLRKRHVAFRQLYELMGELDCTAAVSAYRHTLPFYTPPILAETENIVFEDVYHPLIDNPVCNTLDWRRNALVTGSNASGKSTFIKALALSMICAQSLHLCFARKYRGGICRVITSMAVRDKVYLGESYFVAEIKSMKRIFDSLNTDVRTVCFIDEILKGTNTVERIAASAAILYALGDENTRVMAASHDIELTEVLSVSYENYHFEEQVTDEGIAFDYLLKPGSAQTRNAIHLLRFMGFGEDITGAAAEMADQFTKNRKWVIAPTPPNPPR